MDEIASMMSSLTSRIAALALGMALVFSPAAFSAAAVAQSSKDYQTVTEPALKQGMEVPEPTGPAGSGITMPGFSLASVTTS